MKTNWQYFAVLGLAMAAVGLPAQFAVAQDAADDDEVIEVVTTIGSRSSQPRSASDKPVAVDSNSRN